MVSREKTVDVTPTTLDRVETQWHNTGYLVFGPASTGPCTVAEEGWHVEGVETPDFYKSVASGELLPHTRYLNTSYKHVQDTSATYERRRLDLGGVLIRLHEPNVWKDGESSWQLGPSEFGADEEFDLAEWDYLIQQAAARIYSRGHDTLTFLAEIRKTTKMLKGVSGKLLSLSEGMSVRKAAQLWLEARYGWRTLLYDIVDLHDAVQSLNDKRRRFSERAGHTSRDQVLVANTSYDLDGYCTFQRHVMTYRELSRRGSVTADIEPPRFQFNPVTTAWELIPYSFVIDWLIGVGESLESLSFQLLASKHVSSVGYKLTTRKEWKEWDVSWKNSNWGGTFRRESTSTRVTQERIPMAIPTTPQLRLKLDEYKVLDLAALIRLRLR